MKLEVGKTYVTTRSAALKFTILAHVGRWMIGYYHGDLTTCPNPARWDAECDHTGITEYTPPRTITGYLNVYVDAHFGSHRSPDAAITGRTPACLATLEITYTEDPTGAGPGTASVKVLP